MTDQQSQTSADFGNPPWGSYYDRLYPQRTVAEFGRWWMATASVDRVRRLWAQREQLRTDWDSDTAEGVVLDAVPQIAFPACLRCAWLGSATPMGMDAWRQRVLAESVEHACRVHDEKSEHG